MVMDASQDPTAIAATDLLNRYGFDVGAFSAEQLVGYWLRSYPSQWVQAAVVEALYQGRYKSVSVGQILAIWKRRGQPIYHYSFEFERMVCGHLSRIPTQEVGMDAAAPPEFPEPITPSAAPSECAPPLPLGLEEVSLLAPAPLGEGSVPEKEEAIATPISDPFPPEFELLTQPWSPQPTEVGTHPIDQFVPDPEISMFYEKLRAVAQDQQN